jgi:tripartite motif-containing protein 71
VSNCFVLFCYYNFEIFFSPESSSQIDNSKNGNNIFSNILDPFDLNRCNPNKQLNYKIDNQNPLDIVYGASAIIKPKSVSRSASPHSSSSSSHSIYCGRCENNASNRCLDCNDVFCSECVNEHIINSFTEKHNIISIAKNTINPIGAPSAATLGDIHITHSFNEPQCAEHLEFLRFLCDTCKKVVCQECTLKEHKDHEYTSITNISKDMAKEKLKAVYDSSKLGIKFIKSSIDRAVAYSQSIERDSLDITSRVRKALRLLILAAEDRERILLEQVDKYRQQKIANLSDQMLGLRSALGKD